jgi:C-terminal processing protease CtpA/Prc
MLAPAHEYLATALTLIEQHALHRRRLDWSCLRAGALQWARNAQVPADTYDALRWVLTQLDDRHSFFALPEQGEAAIVSGRYDREVTAPRGHLRPDRIAYLHVPGFRGSPQHCTHYATTLQAAIARLDANAPIGWLVDLTDNGGGNMWPMLAGLGPILGEGRLGGFVFPDGPPVPWFYVAGQAGVGNSCLTQTATDPYCLQNNDVPVAVLTSGRTASSGEAVALAFCGRVWTRRFGTPTRGLTSANEGFSLPDGATIMLTVATFVDRMGQTCDGALAPDELVDGESAMIQAAATAWIEGLSSA